MAFPTVTSQFFWPIELVELIDCASYQVIKFVEGCKNPLDVAKKVIKEIEYPFYMGRPDDTHVLNCFRGKWCKTIRLDFWQPASWTAAIKIGDCEDTSILFVAGCRAIGVSADRVYVVYGYVMGSEEILGGHAWAYAKHSCFGDDDFHYIETTLDEPPKEYPPVTDIRKPFSWGGWTLVPEIIWNDGHYEVITHAGISSSIIKFMSKKKIKEGTGYMDFGLKEKETRRKYEAIQSMWGIKVKPLKKAGLLAKLRWRH